MPITYRDARSADAEAICRVVRRSITECCAADHGGDLRLLTAWLANKTPDTVRDWLHSKPSIAVIACRNEDAVGFGMATPGEIKLCYVVPELRFQGVGKALLQRLEQAAIHSTEPALRLDSTRTAQDFYARNGFSPDGDPISAFGLTAQPMRKPLTFH